MSDTYTKLFSSITASTIVSEPLATRWLWVTMLAMADASGNVWGSVPGLARIANIELADAERALAAFLAPDRYSRTKDNEGRRIEEIEGGWRLLNHAKYRAIRSAEERREYMREYMRNRRSEGVASKQNCKQPLDKSTEVTPPTPTPTQEKKDQKQKQPSPAATALPDPPDSVDREAWLGFVAMRAKQRHPLTPRAAKLVIAELEKLRAKGHDPTAVLDQSTRNGWRDVFALRNDHGAPDANRTSNRTSSRNLAPFERVAAANAEAELRESAGRVIEGAFRAG